MRRGSWLERDLVGDTSAHECETRLWLGSAAKAAVRSRWPLVGALAASAVACLTGVAALFWAVPTVYLAQFAVAFFDARTRQAARHLARQLPIELPAAASFTDGRARRLVERLERARQTTDSVVLYGPVGPPFDVTPLIDRVRQLERDVVVLAARVEYLERFLDASPPATLVTDIARFEEQQKGLEGVSKQFDRVIARCREHLDQLASLSNRMNEACGMAEDLLRTLEQIPSKILGLQLTRIEFCDCRTADARKEAATILESFGALEQAISDLPCRDTSPQ